MKIYTSIFLLFFSWVLSAQNEDAAQQLTLKDIWASGKFRAQYVYGLRSMNDGMHFTELRNDRSSASSSIVQGHYEGNEDEKILLTTQDLVATPTPENGSIGIEDYAFSADEKQVLISTGTEKIYRHSTREWNYVVNLETKNIHLISEEKNRYATFDPAGDNIAFVKGNNLYYYNIASKKETQITQEGRVNEIICGATDWVYEEEFAFDKAFFWSPDGKKVAYYIFMEGVVNEFNMPMYEGKLYPKDNRFRYPKAGEANSEVRIAIYDLETKKSTAVQVNDHYIPRIKWSNSSEYLTVIGMNRHQNDLKLYWVNSTDGSAKVILNEKNKTYIDIHDNLTFLEDNKSFLWTSELGGFNHIYLYKDLGKKKQAVTEGNWEVTNVYGFDEKAGTIYFQAAKESPLQREVYSVKLNGGGLKKLSSQSGTNNANFSKGFTYFINYHSSAKTPHFISLHEKSGKQIKVLKDNQTLKDLLALHNMSTPEFMQIPGADSTPLNAFMIKPKNFDANKKYPVLMYVYGGPGSQTVKDSWGSNNYLWYQMMANKGYIIVSVDNRGTGARGEEFKKMTYLQLGKHETEDQIAAAKWLANQSYVDKDRIGIWGWSYGGYMS
jgi:dipeptidyl-peptidase-4